MISHPSNPAIDRSTVHHGTKIDDRSRMITISASSAVVWLSGLIIILSLVAASAGLFWQDGEGPTTVTTVHGETVELQGEGVYRYDSILKAGANKGADVVTLVVSIPLLLVATYFFRHGSLRGAWLLTGTLVWFLYLYASLALGTAYNNLFLLYVALFSAALGAFVLAFGSIDLQALPAQVSSRLPRRGLAFFMIGSGVVTLGVWIEAPISALIKRQPPSVIEHSTTLFTHALDLAIIVPAAILAGVLILRRAPLGYLMAFSLLILEVLLAPMIALQTAFQLQAGVTFTTAEIVGPIGGFVVIALIAIWFLVALLRTIGVDESALQQSGATSYQCCEQGSDRDALRADGLVHQTRARLEEW
ncbi:MAG TPA: hypothetical protein VGR29_01000 [Thermomicrobiales bacterium]|nr:hypothetical protein [Thermomicrobiales bacterium]